MIRTILILALAALLSGCISSAPIVPVTAANSSAISTCQSDATLHNDVVIGDFVVGGAASGLSAAAAGIADTNTKTDFAIAASAVAALTIAGAAIAGYTATNFANSNCSSVVGALPPTPVGSKAK
jgi:orotate phosphoribosyltransferase-like protein